MKVLKTLCLASLALALVISVTDARSHRRHHSRRQQEEEQPAAEQVQQEEPKPVEIEPAQSQEAVSGSEEKARPLRKPQVLCDANTAAATLAKPDQVETSDEKTSFEVIEPASPESLEIEPMKPTPPKSKKLEKPKGKVVPAPKSSEESMSDEGDDDEEKENESGNNFSAALDSLEEPEAPKALTSGEIPDENGSKAVESEEKPKARRSKHNRKDIRKIEKPYRRRVVFHSSDEE